MRLTYGLDARVLFEPVCVTSDSSPNIDAVSGSHEVRHRTRLRCDVERQRTLALTNAVSDRIRAGQLKRAQQEQLSRLQRLGKRLMVERRKLAFRQNNALQLFQIAGDPDRLEHTFRRRCAREHRILNLEHSDRRRLETRQV